MTLRSFGVRRLAFALPLALLTLASNARADDKGCKVEEVSGTLASTQVVGAACPSPIGLCTSGKLTGDLAGDFFYTALSVIFLSDGVTAIFEGTIVVTTRRGTITEHDHTIANVQTGALVDVIPLLGGTKHWKGVTGTLDLTGTFNFATGVGASTYHGVISRLGND